MKDKIENRSYIEVQNNWKNRILQERKQKYKVQ